MALGGMANRTGSRVATVVRVSGAEKTVGEKEEGKDLGKGSCE